MRKAQYLLRVAIITSGVTVAQPLTQGTRKEGRDGAEDMTLALLFLWTFPLPDSPGLGSVKRRGKETGPDKSPGLLGPGPSSLSARKTPPCLSVPGLSGWEARSPVPMAVPDFCSWLLRQDERSGDRERAEDRQQEDRDRNKKATSANIRVGKDVVGW